MLLPTKLLLLVLLFIISIVLHELGHYLAGKFLGYKATLKITTKEISVDFKNIKWGFGVNKTDKKLILASGILLGLVPNAIAFVMLTIKGAEAAVLITSYFLSMVYITGCSYDLEELNK